MKILHTADWHIGKRLYQHELIADHQLYFEWLITLIKEQKIEVLLVSGDIFDLANPTNEAKELYYSVLSRLSVLNIQVVLTGGNHDSPAMLNAPKELLKALNIQVVGSVPNQIEELIIPLGNPENPEVVVAAVPFIRDNDLRKLAPAQSYEERNDAVKEGIKEVFTQAADAITAKFPEAIAFAMGHLYAHGVSTSDSEREIQVGNLAGFESTEFPESFKYVALGHIHKPQKAGANHILYSGSPIPLSFSEKKDEKRMILIETKAKEVAKITSIAVPSWRKLQQLSGDLALIKQNYADLIGQDTSLLTFVEVELVLEQREQSIIFELERWCQEMNQTHKDHVQILKYRIRLTAQNALDAAELFEASDINDLAPKEVFAKKLKTEPISEEDEQLLLEVFQELVQEQNQQG